MNNKLANTLGIMLSEALPQVSDSGIQQLVEMLAFPSRQASLKIISNLLNEGGSASELLAALMHGRDVVLQDRMAAIPSTDMDQQHEEMQRILLHFDRIYMSLIHAIEQCRHQQLDALKAQLADEGQALMLSKARNIWLKAGCIEFYNYFDEMPVIANVTVRDIREDGVSVSLTKELALTIAAGEHRCYAHVRLPNSKLCLRMGVESASRNAVHWKNAGIMEIAKERRRHIRILCVEHQKAIVRRPHGPKWDITIRDFSSTGLGIVGEDQLPGKVGDMMHCSFQMRRTTFDLKGAIRWKSEGDSGKTRLGLELNTDHISMQKLQHEASLQQKEALGRLQMRGVPDCLIRS